MSNTSNAITLLQNLTTFLSNLEADNVRTGNLEIDAETRRLLTVRLDTFAAFVWDYGSRAQQNSTQAARQTANNGLAPTIPAEYKALDDHIKALNAQIAVLQNPTQTPRRVHTTLQ